MKTLALVAALALPAAPAFAAGAANFVLVNGTGTALVDLSIRRSGAQEWNTLGQAPGAGARAAMTFSDPDCAFDLRATVGGAGPVTWAGVNLCDVKPVTLQHDSTAGAWADYDQ